MILMFQQVTVIDECADGAGITEIHAQLHARKLVAVAVPVSHVHRVAKIRLIQRDSVPLPQNEVDLVNVKSMQLLGAVLDDPVLDWPSTVM